MFYRNFMEGNDEMGSSFYIASLKRDLRHKKTSNRKKVL